jgi:hypothetical protein
MASRKIACISYILTFSILWFLSEWYFYTHHAPLKLLILLPVLPIALAVALILGAFKTDSAFYFGTRSGLGILILLFFVVFLKRRYLLAFKDQPETVPGTVVVDTHAGIVIYWFIIFVFGFLLLVD